MKVCDFYRHYELLCKSWASHGYWSQKPVCYMQICKLPRSRLSKPESHDSAITFLFTCTHSHFNLSRSEMMFNYTNVSRTSARRVIMVKSLIRQSYDDDIKKEWDRDRSFVFNISNNRVCHGISLSLFIAIFICCSLSGLQENTSGLFSEESKTLLECIVRSRLYI